MSQETQVTCPECGNEQSSSAPFCENCGYRIRRTDTVKEGHEAITPEILNEARRKASEARERKRRPEATSKSNQAESSQEKKTVHDVPAIGPEDTPQQASDPRPANQRKGSQTYVEGLRSVSSDDAPDASDDPAAAAPPASTSRSFEQDQHRTGPSLVVWGTVWMSLTAVAVLAVYFVMANKQKNDGPPQSATGPSEKITIEEGPFLRGLDGEVRSFMLQMCQKVDEDPKENCRQEKLLKGEFPEKTVDLSTYEIDSKEVTVGRYEECVAAESCEPVDYKECDVWTHQGLQVALRVPKAMREPTRPVVCVRRQDAKNFCEWAGGELPSADQWEKAARGTKGRLFPWGDSWSSELANWGEMDIARTYIVGELDGFEWTAPPGNYPKGKSKYGLYDAAGNVAEWTDTDDELKGEARGGSWTSTPFDLRVTSRLFLNADDRRTDVGFRCTY